MNRLKLGLLVYVCGFLSLSLSLVIYNLHMLIICFSLCLVTPHHTHQKINSYFHYDVTHCTYTHDKYALKIFQNLLLSMRFWWCACVCVFVIYNLEVDERASMRAYNQITLPFQFYLSHLKLPSWRILVFVCVLRPRRVGLYVHLKKSGASHSTKSNSGYKWVSYRI